MLAVLATNLLVTTVKITLGLVTGALAVVADGFHSLVDSSSNLIGLAAIRLANRPPDEKYPYGYRRYETVGALAIGGLLLAAAWEIAESILNRLSGSPPPEISLLAFVLVVLTFPVNLLIVYLETRAGKRLNSELLLADATHTRTDLWVTGSVVISLAAIWLGLPWVDLVVAGGVGVLIIRAAFSILGSAASTLTDAVAISPERVEAIALGVPGVLHVHNVRSRGAPDTAFVDLHIKVYSGMSTEQAHALASEVERRLVDGVAEIADALVHIEPAQENPPSRWEKIAYTLRQVADGMKLGLHDLHISENPAGGYNIELHLEMPGEVSLREAHDLAEDFEKRIYALEDAPNQLITHMEPLHGEFTVINTEVDDALRLSIRAWLNQAVLPGRVLEVQFYQTGNHLSVVLRFALPGQLSLAEAHQAAEDIEMGLRLNFPKVYRVVAHVEPEITEAASEEKNTSAGPG